MTDTEKIAAISAELDDLNRLREFTKKHSAHGNDLQFAESEALRHVEEIIKGIYKLHGR